MVRLARLGVMTIFVYSNLAFLAVAVYAQSKLSVPTITVYKAPT
jgi:hypothetical protein